MNTIKIITFIFFSVLYVSAFGQQFDNTQSNVTQAKVVKKIKIRHADPQLILLLLAGKTNRNTPPEISTVVNKP